MLQRRNNSTTVGQLLDQELGVLREFLSSLDEVKVGLCDIEHRLKGQKQDFDGQQRCLDDQNEILAEIAASLSGFVKGQSTLLERQETLDNASRQQTMLAEEHYKAHVLDPAGRQVFPSIDLLNSALCGEVPSAELLGLVGGVKAQLLEFLASLGIEAVEVKEGVKFDPKIMRPISNEVTHDRRKGGKICKCFKTGFKRGERFLRQAFVSIYKCKQLCD